MHYRTTLKINFKPLSQKTCRTSTQYKKYHPAMALFLMLVLSLFFTGCSSVSSLVGGRHKHDYAQNFERIQSYNFHPVSNILKNNSDFQFISNSGVLLSIENGMVTKKLRKERNIEPEIWVNYYFSGENNVSVGDLNDLFQYNLGLAWDDKYGTGQGIANNNYQFSKRTLIIDFVTSKNNRLIWRGSTLTSIKAGDSAQSKREALKNAVKIILAPFPPENNFSSLKTPVFDE
jgi:hypothetical protein